MKIRASTTLLELAVELGKLGVQDLHVGIAPGAQRAYRATLMTRDVRTVGEGNSLSEAIDDALARLLHRSAESVTS